MLFKHGNFRYLVYTKCLVATFNSHCLMGKMHWATLRVDKNQMTFQFECFHYVLFPTKGERGTTGTRGETGLKGDKVSFQRQYSFRRVIVEWASAVPVRQATAPPLPREGETCAWGADREHREPGATRKYTMNELILKVTHQEIQTTTLNLKKGKKHYSGFVLEFPVARWCI